MRNPDDLALRSRGRACNDSISDILRPGELEAMEATIRGHCDGILSALGIGADDPNTKGTAARMAKMYVREIFSGRFQPPPATTDFPNTRKLDEIVIVGPTRVRSACAHHFCPIEGTAVIAVIPSKRIIGLSKFARLTDWIMARPQIQEEATIQLADAIQQAIKPRALGVVITASHSCMTWRGVREAGSMATTSVMRGIFKTDARARAECLTLIGTNRCQ